MGRRYRLSSRGAAVLPTCSACGGDIYVLTHKLVACAFAVGEGACGKQLHHEPCASKTNSANNNPRCQAHANQVQ